uniref:Uncharacterized protein n=1 Tax=Setaria viridis TaxID=4556 RepID=A0A4U6W7U0_SETVI|nr:hypothetical protein SEVIR_2G251366v2 [Setaria viridis]
MYLLLPVITVFISDTVIFILTFLFFAITHLHLSWSCGSIRSQGIIICVGVFASTIAAATANITPFTAIGFGIITIHLGAQRVETQKERPKTTQWKEDETTKRAEGRPNASSEHPTIQHTHLMLLQNTRTIQHFSLRRALKPETISALSGKAMEKRG